jgi:hypothetical protein
MLERDAEELDRDRLKALDGPTLIRRVTSIRLRDPEPDGSRRDHCRIRAEGQQKLLLEIRQQRAANLENS